MKQKAAANPEPERIGVAETATIMNVTPGRIQQLDKLLKPERVGKRRVRVYLRDAIIAIALDRAAARARQS